MMDDLYRPELHFSPRKNWMNDPNGCVFRDGVYHLYFQYHPHGTQWGPMHWGHAVSTDLLHWEEKDIALYPDDRFGMAFSGSAVVDAENVSGFFPDGSGLLAFYTGHIAQEGGTGGLQQQCLACSPDNGNTWVPYEGNPVVPNPGIADFRDPKVFYHRESRSWVMVVVAGYSVLFYRSENLREWVVSGTFGEGYGLQEGVWECPDLFPLAHPGRPGETIWVLAVSCLGDSRPNFSPVQYFLGTFDGRTFQCLSDPDTVRLTDYGHDFYATQTWFGLAEHQDRTVWIGWANHWAYANDVPTGEWRGVMSLPRELSLVERHGDIRLRQQPVRELDRLQVVSGDRLARGQGIHDLRYRIENPAHASVDAVFSYEDGAEVSVRWNHLDNELSIDRRNVSLGGFHPDFNGLPSVVLDRDDFREGIDVRILLDRSLVEVFALDGTITFTSQIFPQAPLKGVRLDEGADSSVSGFRHWILDSNPGL